MVEKLLWVHGLPGVQSGSKLTDVSMVIAWEDVRMQERYTFKTAEIADDCTNYCQSCGERGEFQCKAKDVGLETFVKCLEENPVLCNHSLAYGHGHFCKSPARVYMAKRFQE